MKVGHISYSDADGGAARAAYRVHRALLSQHIDSRMYVVKKITDDREVVGPTGAVAKSLPFVRNHMAHLLSNFAVHDSTVPRSLALTGSGLLARAAADGCDVINLHSIGGEAVDLRELSLVSKPLVWRVADMWPFCGAEHYAETGPSARWRLGYERTQPETAVRFDIDRFVWRRKVKYVPQSVKFVATTSFVAKCLQASALFASCSVTVIPNTLDTRQYQPWPREVSRAILGLPQDVQIVLFGAVGGGKDRRKGWDLLQAALVRVAKNLDIHAVVFGQSTPVEPPELGLPLHWMGRINDDATLSLLYSAADVMIVPSRQETFGQTASEAQACGTPVVAFAATGLTDVVEHRVTGYLAEPYSSADLANGIAWVLEDKGRLATLSSAARDRAVRLWASEVVAARYCEVYKNAIGTQ